MLNKSKKSLKLKILVVEPEQDIRYIYRIFFESMGLRVAIVESGCQCLNQIAVCKYNEQNQYDKIIRGNYDIIVIDTHIRDSDAFCITKEILYQAPEQRIILTTTLPIDIIKTKNITNKIDTIEILQKPFELDKLFSLIEKGSSIRMNTETEEMLFVTN